MPSNFNWRSLASWKGRGGPQFWLRITVGVLGVLNAVALFLYLAPPGGSRQELMRESQNLNATITATRQQSVRLKKKSEKVQMGGEQAVDFQSRYIFPKRLAYESIISEIQRMAQAAKLTERDGQWTEEPIEGTADLSLLTNTVNFEGPYTSLMRFLYEVDRSPKFLMLDTLTATPQKPGDVLAQIRFQAVVREEPSPAGEKQ
jgi:Tfp pilus assembly protein PilO